MAKRGAPSSFRPWRLVACATNERPSNPAWRETRGLSAIARRGSLVALNSFGTIRLFDVADPREVRTLGTLELDLGGMAEDYPIGFDRDGRVLLAGPAAIHVVDVLDSMRPRLAATHAITPPLARGTFLDGILYRHARKAGGLYAQDGAHTTAFDAELRSAPSTFARAGDHVYAIGALGELRVYRADLALVRTRACEVAYDARVIPVGALDLLVIVSSTSVRIVDVATPADPKLQKTAYKRSACSGGGVGGTTLYLIDGEYEGPQWITTVALGRPQSIAGAREPFTDDPELGTGLLLVEPRGRELLVLTTTARFAVMEPP